MSSKEKAETDKKNYKHVQQIVKNHGSEIRKSEANNLQLDLYYKASNKTLLLWALGLILHDFIYKCMVRSLNKKNSLETIKDRIAVRTVSPKKLNFNLFVLIVAPGPLKG